MYLEDLKRKIVSEMGHFVSILNHLLGLESAETLYKSITNVLDSK